MKALLYPIIYTYIIMWCYAFDQLRMEDADKIDEQEIGAERGFLEIWIAVAWQTLVHLTLAESTQQAIALVLGKQLTTCHQRLAIAHKKPAVGRGCLVDNFLW